MDFIDKVIKELGFAKVELREDGNYDCYNLHPWWVDTYSREELEYELNNIGDAEVVVTQPHVQEYEFFADFIDELSERRS
jgi:hypothetical protein